MDKSEIRRRIDENNERIEILLKPDVFVFNPEVKALLNENRELQKRCPHKFVCGVCAFCDKEETK